MLLYLQRRLMILCFKIKGGVYCSPLKQKNPHECGAFKYRFFYFFLNFLYASAAPPAAKSPNPPMGA